MLGGVPPGRVAVCAICLPLLTACTGSSRTPTVTSEPTGKPPRQATISPLPASTTAVRLPGPCGPVAEGQRLAELLADVNAADGAAAAKLFAPNGLWEPYEHLDPPNGTLGSLRTAGDISAFVREVHQRGERWTDGRLLSPEGSANLPEATVYGLSITVLVGGRARSDGGKVAVDCGTGRITHMVGPVGARG
jgi:hypothetical protein